MSAGCSSNTKATNRFKKPPREIDVYQEILLNNDVVGSLQQE